MKQKPLDAALGYAQRGYPIFPCGPDKAPLVSGGFKAGTLDHEQIRDWWTRWPDALIGIPTGGVSGLAALDIDCHEGAPDGRASIANLEAEHGLLPDGPRVQTPSGGEHRWFTLPEGAALKCSASKLGPGLDLRADGGYILSPGSGLYSWVADTQSLPLPDMPNWMLDILLPKQAPAPATVRPLDGDSERLSRYSQAALDGIESELLRASEGTRNATLNGAAYRIGRLTTAGIVDPDTVRSRLLAAALGAGLTETEALKTIASGLAAGQAVPWQGPADTPGQGYSPDRPASERTRPVAKTEAPAMPQTPSEPQPLFREAAPVMAVDPEMLPEALRGWVVDIAERMGCPLDFPAVGALTVAASLVGAQCAISPKEHDSWSVVPNLWCLIVGSPGSMKSPSLDEVMRPLKCLEAEASEAHDRAMESYQADVRVALALEKKYTKSLENATLKDDLFEASRLSQLIQECQPEPPARTRRIVNDTTSEALGMVLRDNPAGVLVYRDELVGFLRGLDRPGQEGARAFVLESWNGQSGHTVDRISRGVYRIENCCTSILGTTQPAVLASYVTEALTSGDGLLQRFQVVWPDAPSEWKNVDRAPDRAARERASDALLSLASIQGLPACLEGEARPCLRFDGQAQRAFDRWRVALENRLLNSDESPAFQSWLAKTRKLVPGLSLLCHLLDGGRGPVEFEDWLRAEELGRYFESHARRVYGSGESDPHLVLCQRTLEWIATQGSPVTLRDLYQKGPSQVRTKNAAQMVINTLLEHGLVIPQTDGRSVKYSPSVAAEPERKTA